LKLELFALAKGLFIGDPSNGAVPMRRKKIKMYPKSKGLWY
jgi:hypothetical protein